MKKTATFLLLFICCAYRSAACFNFYYSLNKEGNYTSVDAQTPFEKNFDTEFYADKLKKLEAKLQQSHNYMLLSDYAVCLLKLGKPQEGLALLAELSKHYPNEYQVAANLGTAYELNGQPDSALKYIQRDLRLNPKDHAGSEWIHVRILETEVRLKNDPAYLSKNSVLQLDEKQKKDSVVLFQLNIQLHERVPFIPGPNALMAALFIEMGDLSATVKSIEYARAYYMIAKEYYGAATPELDAKIKEMLQLINKYADKKTPPLNRKVHEEGDSEPLGYISYKQLLSSEYNHYNIKWENFNTDVNALLKLVDFTKSPLAVKSEIVSATKSSDELQPVIEKTGTVKTVTDATTPLNAGTPVAAADVPKSNTLLYILIAAIILATGILFLWRKQKGK